MSHEPNENAETDKKLDELAAQRDGVPPPPERLVADPGGKKRLAAIQEAEGLTGEDLSEQYRDQRPGGLAAVVAEAEAAPVHFEQPPNLETPLDAWEDDGWAVGLFERGGDRFLRAARSGVEPTEVQLNPQVGGALVKRLLALKAGEAGDEFWRQQQRIRELEGHKLRAEKMIAALTENNTKLAMAYERASDKRAEAAASLSAMIEILAPRRAPGEDPRDTIRRLMAPRVPMQEPALDPPQHPQILVEERGSETLTPATPEELAGQPPQGQTRNIPTDLLEELEQALRRLGAMPNDPGRPWTGDELVALAVKALADVRLAIMDAGKILADERASENPMGFSFTLRDSVAELLAERDDAAGALHALAKLLGLSEPFPSHDEIAAVALDRIRPADGPVVALGPCAYRVECGGKAITYSGSEPGDVLSLRQLMEDADDPQPWIKPASFSQAEIEAAVRLMNGPVGDYFRSRAKGVAPAREANIVPLIGRCSAPYPNGAGLTCSLGEQHRPPHKGHENHDLTAAVLATW